MPDYCEGCGQTDCDLFYDDEKGYICLDCIGKKTACLDCKNVMQPSVEHINCEKCGLANTVSEYWC